MSHSLCHLVLKLTSPRCESPSGPLVSGLTMMTLTPGSILEKKIYGCESALEIMQTLFCTLWVCGHKSFQSTINTYIA